MQVHFEQPAMRSRKRVKGGRARGGETSAFQSRRIQEFNMLTDS